jgi:sterol desaturase/sphingolipid hydroxylase (fatty acid hydroxylase superfamily)
MNPIVYAIPIFMTSILLEVWLGRNRSRYDAADAITSLHFGVLSQIASAFTRLFGVGLYVLTFENLRLVTLPSDSLWVWLFALIFYDFIYYWVHRFGHEVNLFWAAHQVHHSSEYFNLSTALRQTSTGIFFVWPFYLVMAFLGVPPVVFITVALIDLLYQYWVHTELVRKLGWFDRIFVSPSNHRVHHGQNDYCIDRNYGGILIVWDRIFGTYAEERDEEPVIYGLRKPLSSFNALWGNFNVYRDIWQKMRAQASWQRKLGVWFEPPAGAGVTLQDLPPPQSQRYASSAPTPVLRYAVIQYGLLVIPATHFIASAAALSLADRTLYALLLLWAIVSVGWLLEARAHAKRFEQLRLLACATFFATQSDWFGWSSLADVKLVSSIVILAAALGGTLWLNRSIPARRNLPA